MPSFHPANYPRMANMPLEAFRDVDEPLPDPSKIYPPGVVTISYFFGPPMSLDPRYSEFSEEKRKEQENMPITYIDPESGWEVPIPELSPEEFEALDSKLRSRMPQRAPSFDDYMDEDQDEIPFLNWDDKAVEEDIRNLTDMDIPVPVKAGLVPVAADQPVIINLAAASTASKF